MNKTTLNELACSKRLGFDVEFGERYGIKLLQLQGNTNPQGESFVDIDFLFGPRMTAEEIQLMCDNIAAWIGGELYGTVNIDFSGKPSISIVVEITD